MGLLEEAAGAFAAVEGVKKLDPNAGLVTEAIAAVAGFEGAGAIENFIEKKAEEHKAEEAAKEQQGEPIQIPGCCWPLRVSGQ
jgi:hypothetical protein